MSDTIVVTEDDESPEASSAHDAAVAEGASAVHEENAGQAAEEAKAAADMALAAAQANAESAASAEDSASRAELAATDSQINAEIVMQTLQAQTAAIEALRADLAESRKPAPAPVEDKPESKPDTPPARKRHWYYGG